MIRDALGELIFDARRLADRTEEIVCELLREGPDLLAVADLLEGLEQAAGELKTTMRLVDDREWDERTMGRTA